MMKITFPAYDREERDDMNRPNVGARAWTIAMMAVAQAPAGPDAERSAQVMAVYDAVRAVLQKEGTDKFLNPEGGTVYLERADLKVFKESVDAFRQHVVGGQMDAMVWLDKAIAGAEEMKPALLN